MCTGSDRWIKGHAGVCRTVSLLRLAARRLDKAGPSERGGSLGGRGELASASLQQAGNRSSFLAAGVEERLQTATEGIPRYRGRIVACSSRCTNGSHSGGLEDVVRRSAEPLSSSDTHATSTPSIISIQHPGVPKASFNISSNIITPEHARQDCARWLYSGFQN